MKASFEIPDIDELERFFGTPPIEGPDEGFVSFRVQDKSGLILVFSIRMFEQSVETRLISGDKDIVTVSHELGDRLSVDRDALWCRFVGTNDETNLRVSVADGIQISWATLQTR